MLFRINKERVVNLLAPIAIWLALSLPSVKLLYSGQITNVAVFVLLLSIAFLKFRVTLFKETRDILFIWTIFSLLLLLSYFYGEFSVDVVNVIEYFYLIVVVYLIIFLSSYQTLEKVGLLIFCWGMFVAVWQLGLGINTSRDAGQHYLTVSMPLGAAMAYSMRFIFSVNDSLLNRIFFFISFVVIFLALATLLSRSAYVFNTAILLVFFVAYIFVNNKTGLIYKLFFIAAFLAILVVFYFYFFEKIEFRQMHRFTRLADDAGSESRMTDKYIPALRYIIERPLFGYGLGSSKGLYGNYPHNIFLEIMSVGGSLMMLPFVFMLVLFLKTIFRITKEHLNNSVFVGGGAFCLFFFLQFNSSFPLTNSYIPIGAMILLIIGYGDYAKKSD